MKEVEVPEQMARRNNGSGLGRGLGALLGDAVTQTEAEGLSTLPMEKVRPNKEQPRKQFNDEALNELSESIRLHGVIQPINVRRLSSGYYEIISGERRWRAAREAGLEEIPAVVLEADDRKAMELALIENLQREDLNPMEEARGFRSLMQEFGLTQEEVSRQVGKSRPAVANALRLLGLDQELAQYVEAEIISAGHARAILGLENAADRKAVADRVAQRQLSVRQTEELVRQLNRRQAQPEESPAPLSQVDYAAVAAKELGDTLGRRVKIVTGKKKGRLELEYYGNEDLNDLLEALQGLPRRR
jgi:ParB family chromosome partitioning protein